MSGLSIGIDVGGTKVAAGLVTGAGQVLAHLTEPAPTRSAADLVSLIVSLVERLRTERDVRAVGIGLPGLVNATRDVIRFAPNLPLRDEPLAREVSELIRIPVVLENDANAAAWAEARFGSGRGETHLAMVTVGTGIGGGLVLDGRLYHGANGMAGEFGHITVDPAGPQCSCGKYGCWEAVASGRSLVEVARELASADPARASVLLGLADGSTANIEGPLITEAARVGDAVAIAAFGEVGDWLGRGMASVIALLDVDVFVIGGGVGEAGELLAAPARASLLTHLFGGQYREPPRVVTASLGQAAGLIGAADLALEFAAAAQRA